MTDSVSTLLDMLAAWIFIGLLVLPIFIYVFRERLRAEMNDSDHRLPENPLRRYFQLIAIDLPIVIGLLAIIVLIWPQMIWEMYKK